MLLREIMDSQVRGLTYRRPSKPKSSETLFQIVYYTSSNQPRRTSVYASSKEDAKTKVPGRVHRITELPTSYGKAIDARKK